MAVLLGDGSTGSVGRFLGAFAPLLFFVIVGGIGNYFALPKGHRTRQRLGGALGLLALAGSAGLLIGAETSVPETVLFYIFTVLAFIGGGTLVTRSNPVHGALSFALATLSTCGLFLLLGAPFLMAATMIIYAGAIVVTFLFVIMLAQQAGMTTADHLSREPFLASLTQTVLLCALGVVLFKTYDTSAFDALLDKVARATQASTMDEIEKILGSPQDFSKAFEETLPEVNALDPKDRGSRAHVTLADAINGARKQWGHHDPPSLKAQLRVVHEAGLQVRAMHGNLQTSEGLAVSKNVGTPAGQKPRGLPAANVAALGKALFTDYLLAVELAGMLLLVAAIGALAIAGRREGAAP